MARWFAALLLASYAPGLVRAGDDDTPLALGADVPHPLQALAGRLLAGRAGGARLVAGEGLAEVERLIPEGDSALLEAGPNGFVLRASASADGEFVVAVRGGRSSDPTAEPSKGPPGVAHGIFAALEALGFGFLHPQAVVEPPSGPLLLTDWVGNRTESPRLSLRGTHVHTMHPLEMTNFLNGFAVDGSGEGSGGEDSAWEAGRPDWEAYCAWLVANGQSYVEWMPLEAPEWAAYSMSETRRQRLTSAVAQAHEWGLIVGMDVPVDLGQQHAFKLVKGGCRTAAACWEKAQPRLDWILGLGVDAIATEMGSTEVTKGLSGQALIDLLNTITEHLASAQKDFLIKNHCSAGQSAKGFPDPLAPEKDINFNFLNYYADPRIISMPHTVQFYGFNDPVAGSYGNDNFTYLLDWSEFLVESGRPMVYYPETSYWVTSDINVPLFLPIYAKNRWQDLELLEGRVGELTPESKMRGQNNFESGWAWGYWLNNAAQARAAWRHSTWPELLESIIRPIAAGNTAGAKRLASALDHLIDAQNKTLTYGIGPGEVSQDPRGTPAGMAYIEGWDGLVEIEFALGITPTQPKRVHPRDLWGPFNSGARKWYHESLQPLLAEMNESIGSAAREVEEACHSLEADSPEGARGFLLRDLRHSAKLVALRARQQMHLYEAAATCTKRTSSSCEAATLARQALNEALDVAAEVEHAAVQPERLTDWGDRNWNPTAYQYGYLWPSKRLFYWQRDQEIVERREGEMCFMNIEDPVDIALSAGKTVQELEHDLGNLIGVVPGLRNLAPCIHPLTEEPFVEPHSAAMSASVLQPSVV